MPALRAVYLMLLMVGLATFGVGVARDEQSLAIVGFLLVGASIAIGLFAHRLDR